MTSFEAATAAGVSLQTIHSWVRRGKLKVSRYGNSYVIDPKELAKVKDTRRGKR